MKILVLFLGVLFPLLLILSCEDDFKVRTSEFQVSFHEKPQLINFQGTEPIVISARITPFTFNDINAVAAVLQIFSGDVMIAETDLMDDGIFNVSGDRFKNDGIFSARILPSIFPELGNFNIIATFTVKGDIYKIQDVITVTTNIKPAILSTSFPDTLYENTQTLSFELADDDGLSDLQVLNIFFYNDSLHSILHNQVADSLESLEYPFYSMTIDSSFGVGIKGKKWVRLILSDRLDADTLDLGESVYFVNSPPVITRVNLPDSVRIPLSGVSYISVYASVFEKRGQIEIQEVYFTVGQNKILMFDDGPLGGHGDLLSGDGIFSTIIITDSDDSENTYQFNFNAVDILGQTSLPVTDSLTLYH